MSTIQSIRDALDEQKMAERLSNPIAESRLNYGLAANTVAGPHEFDRVIGDFTRDVFAHCIAPGADMPMFEAVGRAKQILDNAYRRRRQTLKNALADGMDGLNGGMRGILDTIADGLVAESLENYMEDVFDRYIGANVWEEQVAIIKELMEEYGHMLSDSIRSQPPEKYASNYKDLLRDLIDRIRETGTSFRRI